MNGMELLELYHGDIYYLYYVHYFTNSVTPVITVILFGLMIIIVVGLGLIGY